jgi:D-3-phosphoglycerate dehydrogenase
MKVAVLSDLFLTQEVLESAFKERFKDSGLDFEYVYLNDGWPVQPVMDNGEIREYVGDEDETAKVIEDVDIVITHTAPLSEKVISKARNLKVIALARGGPVNVNSKACTQRGIPVLYAPGRNSGAVAEFTIGLILSVSRNIARSHTSLMRDKQWRGDLYVYSEVGKELNSSVVGLIGFGAIGKKVAKVLLAFGSKVLVYDPYLKAEDITALGCHPASFDEILEQSDYISLHGRETDETRGMIGDAQIRKMKNTAYIINSARGGLIDHDALYAALKEKRIAGAALDIFEAEPPLPSSPLFELENVTATTHLGGASVQAAEIGAKVMAQGVYEFIIEKKIPTFCVNKDYVDHM